MRGVCPHHLLHRDSRATCVPASIPRSWGRWTRRCATSRTRPPPRVGLSRATGSVIPAWPGAAAGLGDGRLQAGFRGRPPPGALTPEPVRRNGFDLTVVVDRIGRGRRRRQPDPARSGAGALPAGARIAPRRLPAVGQAAAVLALRRPADRRSYRIAVRRIADGGGGRPRSTTRCVPATSFRSRGPATLSRSSTPPAYLFVAGGIGITPILPMVPRPPAPGIPWQLVYLGRSRATMPFLDELVAAARRALWRSAPDDEFGIAGPRRADRPWPRGCGRLRLRAARGAGRPARSTGSASLAPVGLPLHTDVLGCRRSRRRRVRHRAGPLRPHRPGRRRTRPALAAIRRAVPGVAYSLPSRASAAPGVAGLDGAVEHRDRMLTDSESRHPHASTSRIPFARRRTHARPLGVFGGHRCPRRERTVRAWPLLSPLHADIPEHVSVAVVGAGFAGIGLAVKLREAGFTDFLVSSNVPPTWAAPGRRTPIREPPATCPPTCTRYSFAPNPDWSRTYGTPAARSSTICAASPTSTTCCAHIRFGTDLEIGALGRDADASVAAGTCAADSPPTSRLRDRRVQRGAVPRDLPGRETSRAPVPFPALGSRLRSHRRAGGRDRHRRIRGAVHPRDPAGGRQLTVFQRSAPWIVPRLDRATTASSGRCCAGPAAGKAIRGRLRADRGLRPGWLRGQAVPASLRGGGPRASAPPGPRSGPAPQADPGLRDRLQARDLLRRLFARA